MQCDDGSLYKGKTNDLERRIHEHITGNGAEHTQKHKPVKLVHLESFETEKEAIEREKYLKSGVGREWLKKQLAQSPSMPNHVVAPTSLPCSSGRRADGQENTGIVPQIRFSGFTDAWEQRKLGEIAEIIGGGTPSTSVSNYWDGDIDWYAPAEMEGQRYATKSIRKITEDGLKNSSARMLPAGNTILFTSRAGIGKMAILQRPAATNQGFQSIVLNDGIATYFIYSMGSILKKKAEGIASGSTFLEISGKMLGNIDIMIPQLPEQRKIGAFFKSLDDLITLHQRKHLSFHDPRKKYSFRGKTIAWEQRKLGTFISEVTRRDAESQAPVMMIAAASGFIEQSEKYSSDNAGQSLAKYTVLHRGELAYNHGASKFRKYGSCVNLRLIHII